MVAGKICISPVCENEAQRNGLCRPHNARFQRTGDARLEEPIGDSYWLRSIDRTKTCSFSGCEKLLKTRKYCAGHYKQYIEGRELAPLRRQRTRLSKSEPWKKRAQHVIDQSHDGYDDNGCLPWTATLDGKEYGTVLFEGKYWLAHRLSYCACYGEHAANNETVHHKCTNTLCINPEHLELATLRDNIAEMFERKAFLAKIASLEKQLQELEEKYEALLARQKQCT